MFVYVFVIIWKKSDNDGDNVLRKLIFFQFIKNIKIIIIFLCFKLISHTFSSKKLIQKFSLALYYNKSQKHKYINKMFS